MTARTTRRARLGRSQPSSPPRPVERLGGVDVPTLVIHGDADPLVTPTGGEATAKAVPVPSF